MTISHLLTWLHTLLGGRIALEICISSMTLCDDHAASLTLETKMYRERISRVGLPGTSILKEQISKSR